MGISKDASWFDEGAGYIVRPYAITGGRTHPSRVDFPLITLVAATQSSQSQNGHMDPESVAILDLCQRRPLAVVEIAAHLDLPATVVKELCGDLLDRSMVSIKTPGEEASAPSVELLQRVIDGVHRL